jgi:hypothetical protein
LSFQHTKRSFVHFNGLNKWFFLPGLSGPSGPSLLGVWSSGLGGLSGRLNDGACKDDQEAGARVFIEH